MFKLGVTDRRALARPRTRLGRRRHASLLLLQELAGAEGVEPELYDRLVGFACMPNRVWKRTRTGRMSVLDGVVVDILRRRFGLGSRLAVEDLAASTGVTSVEFHRLLSAAFAIDFVASDLYRDLIAVRSRQWPAGVIFDPSGHEIQYLVGRFVLPGQMEESRAYPVNRALKLLMRRWFVPRARATLARADLHRLGPFEPIDVGAHRVVKLPMLTRETLEAIRAGKGFHFEQCDIMQPLPRRAHVVRAMNILTQDHFPDEQRARAVRNCVEAVLPGGLFIVGWSPTPDPQTVEASVYAVEDRGLVRLACLNGGSEIDRVVATVFSISESTEYPSRVGSHQ